MVLVVLGLACAPCPEAGSDVLFLGDSLLGWNEKSCRSIPAYAARAAGKRYRNAAVNGALMSNGDESIGLQETEGDFEWVVISGGANDLNSRCDCGPCGSTLARLVADDLDSGATVELVDDWVSRGSDVLLLGYYPVANGAWYGFGQCFDTISRLDRRYSDLAASREGVEFFDLGDVLSPETSRGHYAFDRAHPSPRGAALLGEAVARRLSSEL